MGISTSAAALVIFVALFLALGTLHGTAADAVDRITDAERAAVERGLAVRATAVTVTNATYNATVDVFTVTARNTGERAVDMEGLTVVADARFVDRSTFETVTVAGRDSRVWRPGQELRFRDTDGSISTLVDGSAPSYVKLVSATGVAGLREVTLVG